MTDRIAIELLADIPTTHNVSAIGLGTLGVADGTNILDTGVLPPTLFVQYHFMPSNKLRPYAGIDLNYTLFFNESYRCGENRAFGDTA